MPLKVGADFTMNRAPLVRRKAVAVANFRELLRLSHSRSIKLKLVLNDSRGLITSARFLNSPDRPLTPVSAVVGHSSCERLRRHLHRTSPNANVGRATPLIGLGNLLPSA